MSKLVLLFVLIGLIFVACDKNKRASKKLMNAGECNIKSLTVNGSAISLNDGYWQVDECDIYEELCTATWVDSSKTSNIYWQFNEKAKTFNISRMVAPEDCEDFYTEAVEQLTYNFSGEYEVIESKRKSKIFESNKTIGHNGSKVRIELERK